MVGWGGKGPCVPYIKHVPSTSVECEHLEASILFQVTPCSPCGTILFGTKANFALNACTD